MGVILKANPSIKPGASCRIAARPEYSSIDARMHAGQQGLVCGTFEEDGTLLVAVSIKSPSAITWVDHRDILTIWR